MAKKGKKVDAQPETPSDPTLTPAPTNQPIRKKAEHDYIDANGTVVDNIEQATGVRYTDLRTGESFAYQVPGAVAGSAATMLAIFGLKTLQTNTASGNRNAPGGSDISDVKAIEERFTSLRDGQWAEPGAGPRGPKYDLDKLTQALVTVLATETGKPADGFDGGKYRQKLDEDLKYRRAVTGNPKVRDEYHRIAGTPVVDTGSLIL